MITIVHSLQPVPSRPSLEVHTKKTISSSHEKKNSFSLSLSFSRSRFLSTTSLLREESKPITHLEASESAAEPPTASEEAVHAEAHLAEEGISTSEAAPAPVVAAPEVNAAELAARTCFVGGLSWNIDNEWLSSEVYKNLDITEGIVSARVARSNMGKSRG